MQAALPLTNVWEHISSIGFNLELCAIVFPGSRKWGASESGLSVLEFVDKVSKDEIEFVQENSSLDKNALLEKVEADLQTIKSSSKEYQLASRLLKRLRWIPVAGLQGSQHEEFHERDSSSVTEMGQLGKGNFGTVFKAKWHGAEVAQKTIHAPSFSTIEKEVSILAQISRPNVATLLCYTVGKREQTIVMKLMEKDLFTLIQERLKDDRDFPFTMLVAIDIILQIAGGMYYVHGKKIGHRDLKATNILVRHVPKTEYVLVEVADFGESKVKERDMTDFTPNIGSLRWKAPELIKPAGAQSEAKMPYDEVFMEVAKCDIHSFAMVCYEILSGNVPFAEITNPSAIKKKILGGERPKLPDHCPEDLKNLIISCWSLNANVHPCFGDICKKLRYIKYELVMTSAWGMVSTLVYNDIVEKLANSIPSTGVQSMIENTSEYFSTISEFFSECMESIMDSKSQFNSGLEFEIEHSKVHWTEIEHSEVHWTELDPFHETNMATQAEMDRKYFEDLKLRQDHRKAERIRLGLSRDVPGFFQDMDDLVLGKKIAEGAIAEIFEVGERYIAKVFKKIGSLEDLARMWPLGMLNAFDRDSRQGSPLSLIIGATLLKEGRFFNRIAIVMHKMWGDLRKLIDLRMMENNNQGPPFTTNEVFMMMFGIAKDMISLHSESPPILQRPQSFKCTCTRHSTSIPL